MASIQLHYNVATRRLDEEMSHSTQDIRVIPHVHACIDLLLNERADVNFLKTPRQGGREWVLLVCEHLRAQSRTRGSMKGEFTPLE